MRTAHVRKIAPLAGEFPRVAFDRVASASTSEPPAVVMATPRVTDEKRLRLESIQRDYDAMRLALLRAYGDEGEAFPGGSHTLLQQFALLEREQHADLAMILTTRELEDIELRDTRAGHWVARLLGGTTASEDQRRAVFRLQREFDLHYGETGAPTGNAWFDRAVAERTLQTEIHAVLGDSLMAAWLARSRADQDWAR
jgi:hypothetical protein